MGVIFVPVSGVLYWAAADIGAFRLDDATGLDDPAFLEDLAARSRRLPLEKTGGAKRPYTVVGSRSHSNPDIDAILERKRRQYGAIDFLPAGSSLKFCLVAEGKGGSVSAPGSDHEWDTAAGQAIVECAGGGVFEYDKKTPLAYNKENLLNPHFVVAATREDSTGFDPPALTRQRFRLKASILTLIPIPTGQGG